MRLARRRHVLIKKKNLNKCITGFSQTSGDGQMGMEQQQKANTGRRLGRERSSSVCESAHTAVIAWQPRGYLTCVTAAARVCHLCFTARLRRSSLVCTCMSVRVCVVYTPVAASSTVMLVFPSRLPPNTDLIDSARQCHALLAAHSPSPPHLSVWAQQFVQKAPQRYSSHACDAALAWADHDTAMRGKHTGAWCGEEDAFGRWLRFLVTCQIGTKIL